jgi:hypothetical protein
MGSEGYRLWAMGQLDSNVQRPTEGLRSNAARTSIRPLGLSLTPGGGVRLGFIV